METIDVPVTLPRLVICGVACKATIWGCSFDDAVERMVAAKTLDVTLW